MPIVDLKTTLSNLAIGWRIKAKEVRQRAEDALAAKKNELAWIGVKEDTMEHHNNMLMARDWAQPSIDYADFLEKRAAKGDQGILLMPDVFSALAKYPDEMRFSYSIGETIQAALAQDQVETFNPAQPSPLPTASLRVVPYAQVDPSAAWARARNDEIRSEEEQKALDRMQHVLQEVERLGLERGPELTPEIMRDPHAMELVMDADRKHAEKNRPPARFTIMSRPNGVNA